MEEKDREMGWGLRLFFLVLIVGGLWFMHRRTMPADLSQAARSQAEFSQEYRTSAPMLDDMYASFGPGEATEKLRSGAGRAALSAVPGLADPGSDLGRFHRTLAGVLKLGASGDPRVIRSVLNNKFVVRRYMAIPEVGEALASKESFAAYLKAPGNVANWMNDRSVKTVYANDRLFYAVATSRLGMAMLDHPSVIAFLSDSQAVSDVMSANPPLGALFSDPRVIKVLMKNPRTAAAMNRR